MSDQAEAPPKKVGSLRDRIAAFEKAGAGSSTPAPAPPAPRPKPAGFSNWKPRPPSPPSGEPSQSAAPAKPSAGLSATDAKESVKGQSLKERMAALQGKGGFGGAPPVAPKPALEKPKWKPPPVIAAPKDDDDEEDQSRKPLDLEGIVRSPPAPESDPKNETAGGDGEVKESGQGEGGEGVEPDPEEEERQRRAAIAARMARLGGARVGMAAPPVFGKRPPPPPKKRSSVSEEVTHKEAVTSPKLQATSPEAVTSETVTSALSSPPSEVTAEASPPTQARRPSEAGSSVDSSDPHQAARSPPVSMPVPAAPRRAAPPRKKPAKPTGPPPPVPEAEQEAQEAALSSTDIKPSEELPTSTSTTVVAAVVPPKEALVTPLPPTPAANEEDAPPLNIESSEPIKAAEATPAALETGEDAGDALDTPIAARSQSPEPEREAKPEEKVEDKVEEKIEEEPEVDEETKRRQLAERIAKMGGVNPFAAPVLPRRQSSKVLEEPVSPPPADFKEDDSPNASLQDPSVVPEQPVSPPATSNSRRSSKLLEAPLSPPLRDVGKEQPSTGSVATAQAPILPQQVEPEEPLPINDDDEAATKDDKVREEVKPQSPTDRPVVTKPETLEEKEAPLKGQAEVEVEAEADDDSEYSDEDEGVVAAQERTPAPAHSVHSEVEPIVPARVAEPVSEATPASPPPVQHSPEVPHRSAPPPPPPVEDEEELMSGDENEDMARSQILDLPNKDKADTDIAPVTRRETGLSLRSEEKEVASDDSLSEYESQQEEEEEEAVAPVASPPPDAQTVVRNPAPSFVPPPPPPGRPNLPLRSPPPANRALPPAPSAPIPIPSQPAFDVPAPVEVLDDEEGDPIDPTFYSPSRRASQLPTSPDATTTAHDVPAPPESESTRVDAPAESQEDAEAARRRTIAERMAKLGGIKFGAAPPIPGLPKRAPPPPQHQEEERETEEPAVAKESAQPEVDEEEEERARKERIAAKLAGMGGMRIGMMPSAFPPRKSHVLSEDPAPPAPPPRAPPARAPPPPQAHESESEVEGSTVSEDAVKVEAEDSDLEEVHYTDAEEEPAPPPIPSRSARPIRRESADIAPPPPHPSSPPTRPPVPTGLPPRRPSTKSVSSQRRVSGESSVSSPPQRRPSLPKPQPSEYVMVEEPQGYEEEEAPPPPPARPAGGPTRRPSAPPTRLPPPPQQEDSISSQWELPAIPTSNLEIGGSDLEMSWTEAEVPREEHSVMPASTHGRRSSTQTHPQPPPVHVTPTKSAPPAHDLQLSADDLMALWGRVGVQVCEAATNLFERSKKGLVGDGTYPGFIHAVIHEVPNAVLTENYGYMIYKQSGGAVQKRASDIMPGDLVELHDAKFKGHKGLQAYHQNVGADEAVVGVVGEFDAKKSKIKVFQANQHVGQQTVESVSYRLEDMKSGTVKVFRVLEAQ